MNCVDSSSIESRETMLQNDCSDSDSSQADSEDNTVEDATDDGSDSSCSTGSESTAITTHSGTSAHNNRHDDNDEKLQVNIKLVGKETSESLLIDPSSSVGDLKRQIAHRFSVPMERQRLIFFGKLLLDNAQALGPKGACMRLGTINYVHLSPLPDGAKPSDRPTPKMQQQQIPPPQPVQHQPHEYIPHSVTNRQSNDSDTMARSSIAHGSHHDTNPVPIALPVPNLSLEAQLARARRLGAQARERRRRRRRLEVSPYHYALHGLDEDYDDIPITPDDSFSSEYPLRHRYLHPHLHQPPPPSHHHHFHPHYSVRDEVLFSELLGGPFLPSSSLSHSILAHPPVFPPPTLVSRRPEWSHPFSPLASYHYDPLASTRETTTTTTATGSPSATNTSPTTTSAADGWTDLRAGRDRLDGIRLEHRRRQQQEQQELLRQEDDELLRQELLQQVRRSALQLLPTVAEWHSQLERLSQWQPSSPARSTSSSTSSATNTSTALMEDSYTTTTTATTPFALIQDTLDQMDVGIAHTWMTRLRPLLVMTLQQETPLSLSDSWLTMGGPRSLVSSPWFSPPPSSMSSSSPHSIPPPPPGAARYF